MALRDFSLTLNGGVQQLSSVLVTTERGGAQDEAYSQLILQADPANTAAVFIGASSSVSSSVYGFALDPTQASAPPLVLGGFHRGPIKLSEVWVIGTNNEKLHILGVPF